MVICFGEREAKIISPLEIETLPKNLTYILTMNKGLEVMLLDYYEQTLCHAIYPDLKEIRMLLIPW